MLRLILDHSAVKAKAKLRGYGEQSFTESLYCQVAGHQTTSSDAEEIWDVSGFSEFLYCDEVLLITVAMIEGGRLCMHHDSRDYPENPIHVPIASVTEHDRYPSILHTLREVEPLVMTDDEFAAMATEFLLRKGLDVLTANWIDLEIAIRYHSGLTSLSKNFLLEAAKNLRGNLNCI